MALAFVILAYACGGEGTAPLPPPHPVRRRSRLRRPPPESLERKGLLHYYAFQFRLQSANPGVNAVGSGYAGFLSNGLTRNIAVGKAVNFAMWGSDASRTPNGLVNPDNEECRCHQIMLPYPYETGRSYRFQLGPGPSGVEDGSKWWGLWVSDLAADSTTFVGEVRMPAVLNARPAILLHSNVHVFGEDLHWWRTRNGAEEYICSDFEASSLAILNVTAGEDSDRPFRVYPWTTAGNTNIGDNGYETTLCHVTVFMAENGDVQHNVGFWPEPPKSVLGGIESAHYACINVEVTFVQGETALQRSKKHKADFYATSKLKSG